MIAKSLASSLILAIWLCIQSGIILAFSGYAPLLVIILIVLFFNVACASGIIKILSRISTREVEETNIILTTIRDQYKTAGKNKKKIILSSVIMLVAIPLLMMIGIHVIYYWVGDMNVYSIYILGPYYIITYQSKRFQSWLMRGNSGDILS